VNSIANRGSDDRVRIGALLLAAGFSRRFGGIKLTQTLADGRILFQHTLHNLVHSLNEIVVISRPEVAPLLQASVASINTTSNNTNSTILRVFNDAEKGMGATLAYGMQHIPDWDACLICLADMPYIKPATYRSIMAAMDQASIIIPQYQNKPGNPVGFGRDFYSSLRQLQGDSGGRHIIENNQQSVNKLNLDDPALLLDIDTPEDLQRIKPT